MAKTKPTRTTNRLHFSDLAPDRFEDLCLALVQPLHPWIDLRHYGRTGSDGGIDIFARELIEGSVERTWHIQCKRRKSVTASLLRKAIDEALAKSEAPPEVLLTIVAGDVGRDAHEAYVKHASAKGIKTPLLWTATILEAKLYNERRDLLFAYFGIDTSRDARRKETTLIRNIAMKKRLLQVLRKSTGVNPQRVLESPREKLSASEVIVHSVDDASYPEIDENEVGISGWFKVELWNFYHNGLQVILSVETAIINDRREWALVPYDFSPPDGFDLFNVFRLGLLPFENIVEVDADGDEFYPFPHLYCRYSNGGQPYERFTYVPTKGNVYMELRPEDELKLSELP